MTRYAIIKAVATTGEDDLDPQDVGVAGTYGVAMGDGIAEYPSEPRDADRVEPEQGPDGPLIEAAKDIFHDHVGIEVLDDFDITVEILPEGAERPSGWEGSDIDWL